MHFDQRNCMGTIIIPPYISSPLTKISKVPKIFAGMHFEIHQNNF